MTKDTTDMPDEKAAVIRELAEALDAARTIIKAYQHLGIMNGLNTEYLDEALTKHAKIIEESK